MLITWKIVATLGTGAAVVGAGLKAVVGNLAWTVVEGLSKATGLVTGFSVSTWILAGVGLSVLGSVVIGWMESLGANSAEVWAANSAEAPGAPEVCWPGVCWVCCRGWG